MNAGDALVHFGVVEIQRVVEQFRPLLGNCDTDAALRQWTDFKAHVGRNQHFVGVHPLAVFQRISLEDQETENYQNIMKIIHLVSLFPLSNASCERGFSTMKRIKSDWRCRLNNETLNILMRIDMCSKKLEDCEPRPVVNRWWIHVSGMSVKRPNIAPYGPHQ
ncbi:zinc finger protein 862-like [Saccostrea cucullata]|uniref:zinc finger protein 862-like n=1 Tax=Saccostrea cuccullata TaxID=36930 RepID=UPI002ED08A12